jgi:hypothetical protein
MANLTATQISELNLMCPGANRALLGTTVGDIQTNFTGVTKLYNLGAPVAADDDLIVTVANMKVGSYTVAAQPDVPRNITVTHAIVAVGTDTVGTITITGTDVFGATISEVIIPSAGGVATGAKAFKTVTSVVGAGWVIAGGNDTIKVGVGNKLGLPVLIAAATNCILGVVGTANVVPTTTASATLISSCTVDLSAGTYDGTVKVLAFIIQ